MSVLVAAALVTSACSHQIQPQSSPQVTVYYCKAGTDTLVPTPFTVDRRLQGAALENFLVDQLLAGPGDGQNTIVQFPAGTRAAVSVAGDVVTVNFSGTLAKPFRGGASDEVALFKSLTYTLTSVPPYRAVQVLIDGKKAPTLPSGEFEIDEPLTRETFSQ